MSGVDDLLQVEITSRSAWRAWLEEHHTRTEGIWLITYKKHCGDRYVRWGDLVREALCFGWIDSRRRKVDDDRTSMMVTPRKPGSNWSAINKQHVAELEAEGLLAPAGRACIEAAKADGSWTWLDDIEALVVPDDLAVALTDVGQRSQWDAASTSSQKLALYHVKSAKRATTRAARIATIVERLRAGEPPA